MKPYLIIGGLVLLGLFFLPTATGDMKNSKLQNEIDRVASKSGVNPASVDCRNVSTAQICYAEYSSMDTNTAKQMLVTSGYTLVDEQYNRNGRISATNKSESIRVDSESASGAKTTLTLKFKDINVTL